MKGKPAMILLLLVALMVVPAVKADDLGVTLNCSAFNVTVNYGQFLGPHPEAEAVCSGRLVPLTNVTLSGTSWSYLDVTEPLQHAHWSNMNASFSSGTLLVVGKVYTGVDLLELLRWALDGRNPVGLSAEFHTWGEVPVQGHNGTSSVLLEGHWEGTVPLRVDWSRMISLVIFQAVLLINAAIGTVAGVKTGNERLAGLSLSAGFLTGYLAYYLPHFGIDTQLGFFIVLEVSLLVIWLSVITGTSQASKRREQVGRLTVALSLGGLTFIFLWAAFTGNGPFAVGTLLLMLPAMAYLFRFISRTLFEADARGELEKINPLPLGLLLLMPYLPQVLIWGGILESSRLTLVATAVFMGSVFTGLTASWLLRDASHARGRYI